MKKTNIKTVLKLVRYRAKCTEENIKATTMHALCVKLIFPFPYLHRGKVNCSLYPEGNTENGSPFPERSIGRIV